MLPKVGVPINIPITVPTALSESDTYIMAWVMSITMIQKVMNLAGAAAAVKAFKEARSGDIVEPEEVLYRMRICEQCPVRSRRPSVRSRISLMLGRISNKNKVPDKLSKYNCGACGCSLMLLLPSKTRHPDTPEEHESRWVNCWLLSDEERIARAAGTAKENSHPTNRSSTTGCASCR